MCKKMCAHFARGICVGRLTLNSNLSKKMPNIAVRLQGLILFHIPNLFRYFFEPRKQNYNLKTKTKTKNVIHFFFFCFCVRLLISSWWSIWFFFLKKKNKLKMFSNKKGEAKKYNSTIEGALSRSRGVIWIFLFSLFFLHAPSNQSNSFPSTVQQQQQQKRERGKQPWKQAIDCITSRALERFLSWNSTVFQHTVAVTSRRSHRQYLQGDNNR